VTGGLWPAELPETTDETATLAEYLKADLERITRTANDELRTIQRAGMPDFARQAEQARVIDEARTHAVRSVESTIRDLHAVQAQARVEDERQQDAEGLDGADLEKTQVIPVVTDAEAPVEAVNGAVPEPREAVPSERNDAPVAGPQAGQADAQEDEADISKGRHLQGSASSLR
jgi:hypothetical protein